MLSTTWRLLALLALVLCAPGSAPAADELLANAGFERGFAGWTRWGKNTDLITLDQTNTHTGTNSARIQHGNNALYFNSPLNPEQAYELRFFYRLSGEYPSAQVGLGFFKPGGGLRSGGAQKFKIPPPSPGTSSEWTEFRQVFLPTPVTRSCQFLFSAGDGATLWIDDVSLLPVPRPADLAAPPAPWEGLRHRTSNPRFKELLTTEPGHYTVVSWAHDLNPRDKKGFKSPELSNEAAWQKAALAILKETGEAGMGFMDLPGRLDGTEPWRTAEFHRDQFRRYGVRYDVWSEGSSSIAAGLKKGAELLNPTAKALGARPACSWVDAAYVDAQCEILRMLGKQLNGEPFVGYYYGKDEPSIRIPEGKPDRWGKYGQAMAAAVRQDYGFGRFDAPLPKEESFLKDPNKPFRWIAYNRWMNDQFIASRSRLSRALHEADPQARYSPANYWFMSGFQPYDFSRLATCSDLMECDPYASSAERRRGRGVYNHGFGAKFMTDLSAKPVRIVAQAFDYNGYDMSPDDLREWVSQALRCGASAVDYYEMDSPRWTHPDRWKMMLYLSSVITRMNRIAFPTADTAILYTFYTHMSQGPSTSGDQLYAAHALLGEQAGSWFKFVSDAQLERGDASLNPYKAVYLPLATFMTPQATKIIEDYVQAGGVLICGDAEAFGHDLAGNDTSATRERILGVKTLGPKQEGINNEGTRTPRASGEVGKLVLMSAEWGLPRRTNLPIFRPSGGNDASADEDADTPAADNTAPAGGGPIAGFGTPRVIKLADPNAQVIGTYPDGSPAIVSHKLGQGRVITFAANPFAPQVTVDPTPWPAALRGLQHDLGCKVDLPIWHFLIPPPPN